MKTIDKWVLRLRATIPIGQLARPIQPFEEFVCSEIDQLRARIDRLEKQQTTSNPE